MNLLNFVGCEKQKFSQIWPKFLRFLQVVFMYFRNIFSQKEAHQNIG